MGRLHLAIVWTALAMGGAGDAVSAPAPPPREGPPDPYPNPPAARFDPATQRSPGFVDKPSTRPPDRTMGPSRRVDTEGYEETGYTVIGPETMGVETQPGFVPARPQFHVVQSGDTLWDICANYFDDPYLWPKLWSFNEQITNAHWIFPGDRIRLSDPVDGARVSGQAGPGLRFTRTDYGAPSASQFAYVLGRFAYIDEAQLQQHMEIIGGARAKVMMADRDTAYLGYDPAHPPIAGERLAVYEVQRPIHDMAVRGRRHKRYKRGDRLGYLVEIVGEVYVERLAKKSAQAKIVNSVRPIERGYKVGELRNRFDRIGPVPAQSSAMGLVVQVIDDLTLVGERQFVVVNLGHKAGVEVGNLLEVVHKGDAYTPDHVLDIPYSSGHPRRVVGKILIVQVEPRVGLGLVVDAKREIVRGDPVELRAPSVDAGQPVTRGDPDAASGTVRLGPAN
ncbi:MAG: LysM peptidoglycan-binding domain-containing protein [Myxococcales bacterium FL481]|nr:MAG: LysM peptidoglycan-binding domain-containing protein [Myxococcales bacterium FL481]